MQTKGALDRKWHELLNEWVREDTIEVVADKIGICVDTAQRANSGRGILPLTRRAIISALEARVSNQPDQPAMVAMG